MSSYSWDIYLCFTTVVLHWRSLVDTLQNLNLCFPHPNNTNVDETSKQAIEIQSTLAIYVTDSYNYFLMKIRLNALEELSTLNCIRTWKDN